MTARTKAAKFLVLSALIYLAILGVSGELHLSSRALAFFAILWLVQATAELWQSWRRPHRAAPVDMSAEDDIPPAG